MQLSKSISNRRVTRISSGRARTAKLEGKMHSSKSSGKKFGMMLASLAFITASFLSFTPRAQALTISVGTNTVVNNLSVAPLAWVDLTMANGNFAVIYSTRTDSRYSIMFASQTKQAAVGGAAPGWTLSTLYSTTTNASNSNIGKILGGMVKGDGTVVVYYYDEARKNLMYMAGAAPAAQLAPVSVATVTTKGIEVFSDTSRTFASVLFSSLTANGRYELVLASMTSATMGSAITSSMKVTTAASENVESSFQLGLTKGQTGEGTTHVVYYDSISGSLREVYLDATANEAIAVSRNTIDSGNFSDIKIKEDSDKTYLVYTDATNGVKYAVQRRAISGNCWYVQKIDGGSGPNIIVDNDPLRISYLKSGNLWDARGAKGTFFDDFGEDITNKQQGKAQILSNVTKGNACMSDTEPDRGVYQQSDANVLGLINWRSLTGKAENTWTTALPSVQIAAVVTASACSATTANLDPADSSNLGKEGGRTDVNGDYLIHVGSGSKLEVSASSSNWVFFYKSSITMVTVSTITSFGAGARAADLVGVSSPVFSSFAIAAGSQKISTFSVAFLDNGELSDFTAGTNANPISDGFTVSQNFRLVPQSEQGTAPTINTSTSATETGAIPLNGTPATRQAATVSTNTLWARYASTDTTNLPKWYTIVASTKTKAGHIMQGYMVDAVRLLPMQIAFATAASFPINQYGLAGNVSTGLVNTSDQTTLLIRSSYTNIFSNESIGTGQKIADRVNVYLSTTNTLPTGTSFFGDIPFYVTERTNSSMFYATGSIIGASYGNYYVRISSRPTAPTKNPQFAIYDSITISSAAITSVVAVANSTGPGVAGYTDISSTEAVVMSSGMALLHVYGRGFMLTGGTWAVTPSATVYPPTGLPISSHCYVTPTILSSTEAYLAVDFSSAPDQSVVDRTFYVYFATGHAGPSGGRFSGMVEGSTVIARSALPVVRISTAAITAINPSSVTTTRLWSLTLSGRGFTQYGSTLTFYSTDGATQTAVYANVSGTGYGNQANGQYSIFNTTTVVVDFRHPHFIGKTFYAVYSSSNGATKFSSAYNNVYVTVATPTIAVQAPYILGVPRHYIYNSTPDVTIGLMMSPGGLVAASSISIVNPSDASVVLTTLAVVNAPLWSAVTSTGAFGAFTTSGTHAAAAGEYDVKYTIIMSSNYNNHPPYTITLSTKIYVVAASITNATLSSHPRAISTLKIATYTITGTGLLPSVTFWLELDKTSDRVGALYRSTNVADYSSLNVGFDLRAATATSSSWYIKGESKNHAASSTQTLTSPAISISTIPILSALSWEAFSSRSNAFANTAVTVRVAGEGLLAGATVSMIYQGTALATLGTTDYASANIANTSIRIGTMDYVYGDNVTVSTNLSTAYQSTGSVTVDISSALPSKSWALQLTHAIDLQQIGLAVPQLSGDGTKVAQAWNRGTRHDSDVSSFTVVDSSAPAAPTGLTVLSAGVKTVTLRWISPGDDGFTNSLDGNAKFIVYYSSGEDIRGWGCAPCYSSAALSLAGKLDASPTNYSFVMTWAQFLPWNVTDADTSIGTSTFKSTFENVNPNYTGLYSARGIRVSTYTLGIGDVTVKDSTSSASGTTGNTSIVPGKVIEASLTIDPGTKDGNYWFIVRAQDDAGNRSATDIVYSTAFAKILAGAGQPPESTSGDTVYDPNKVNNVSLTFPADADGFKIVAELTNIPIGAFTTAFDWSKVVVSENAPADEGSFVGAGRKFLNFDSVPEQPKKPIPLIISYNSTYLASKGIDETKIHNWKKSGTALSQVPVSTIDNQNKKISSIISGFSSYGAGAGKSITDLSEAKVGPNPCRPSQGYTYVTFADLPAETIIKIYTIAGDLVKQLQADASGQKRWDLINEDGKDVASGVYFVLLNGGGGTKTMKLAVQR